LDKKDDLPADDAGALDKRMNYPAAELRGIQLKKNLLFLEACLREAASAKAGGRIKVGVMRRSFPPHPDPLPLGEREGHSSPQHSWGVFWHIFIKSVRKGENYGHQEGSQKSGKKGCKKRRCL